MTKPADNPRPAIRETVEIIEAAEALVVGLIRASQDGLRPGEVLEVITSNLGRLSVAAEGISNVPEELKDLSIEEVRQLAHRAVDFLTAVLEAAR